MPTPMDPTSTGFLFAENRNQPMHVGGLQLFRKPEGAGRNFVKDLFEEMLTYDQPAPLFLKRPTRSLTTAGQWFWTEDQQFDIEYHFRHSALPKPGRIRELLELCGRLHSTRLALERPLWEVHLIEGLRDGRVAMYTKMHHALVDGVSSMRLLQRVLSQDPDELDMAPMWSAEHSRGRSSEQPDPAGGGSVLDIPGTALKTALGISAEAAGLPGALLRRCPTACATRPPRCRSTRRAPSSTRRSPGPGGSPPRTGRWSASRPSEGQRHHRQRRGARDVQRRDADLPHRAGRAPRLLAGGDGAGRLQAKNSQSASASAATRWAR